MNSATQSARARLALCTSAGLQRRFGSAASGTASVTVAKREAQLALPQCLREATRCASAVCAREDPRTPRALPRAVGG